MRLADLLDVDIVRLLQNMDLLACDGAEDADGETGTREGVALDQMRRDRQQSTQCADLVCDGSDIRSRKVKGRTLEELAEGLYELEFHILE